MAGRARARRRAEDIILPGSEPYPLREESDHGPLWQAIRAVEAKTNYILGMLALLVPLTIAVFVAVILK